MVYVNCGLLEDYDAAFEELDMVVNGQIVGAHLLAEERQAVRRQYGLICERLLQMLTNLKAVSVGLEDATLKLPAAAAAETLAQALGDGMETRRHPRARTISLRESRVTGVKRFRLLRTKTYGFLMQNMPDGNRDARLIDFGLRPSSLRRNNATILTCVSSSI